MKSLYSLKGDIWHHPVLLDFLMCQQIRCIITLKLKKLKVCVSYLAQVTNQPGVCRWFSEAGQPVCVPGVSHQQPGCPSCNHNSESCADHKQDLTEAGPAEDPREDALEERHPESG